MARHSSSRKRESVRGGTVLISRSVLCTMIGISERQLTVWEQEEFLAPASRNDIDGILYDRTALKRARIIRTLSEELEVNLPGIGVILHLLDQLSD